MRESNNYHFPNILRNEISFIDKINKKKCKNKCLMWGLLPLEAFRILEKSNFTFFYQILGGLANFIKSVEVSVRLDSVKSVFLIRVDIFY